MEILYLRVELSKKPKLLLITKMTSKALDSTFRERGGPKIGQNNGRNVRML
jgi:hypothetical protein